MVKRTGAEAGLLFLFTAFVLLCVYYNSPALAGSGNYILSRPFSYEISYSSTVENPYAAPISNLEIFVPVIQDEPPYQTVKSVSVTPKPDKTYTDSFGNKIARFTFKKFDGRKKITITVKASLTVKNVNFLADFEKVSVNKNSKNLSLYLKSEENMEIADPLFKTKMAQILKGEKNPYLRALKFYDYLCREVSFDEGFEPRGALWSLKNGKARCTDSAYLFAALCRVAGIPSSYIGGIYAGNIPDNDPRPRTYKLAHAWTRIYLAPYGWMPVDPTLGRFDSISRYNCFLEQSGNYILMWKGFRDPFYYTVNGRQNGTPLRLYFSSQVRKVKTTPDPPSNFSFSGNSKKKNSKPKIPASAESLYKKGKEALDRGDYYNASVNLEKAISLYDRYPPAYEALAKAYYKAGKINSLISRFKDKAKKSPSNPYYHYILGLSNAYLENYSDAVSELKKSLKLENNSAGLHNCLGYIYLQTKQTEKSYKELVTAIKLDPDNPLPYNNLLALYHRTANYKELIKLGNAAIKYFPQNASLYAETAYGYLNDGGNQQAGALLEKAVSLEPSNGLYHALLGRAYFQLQQKERAIQEINKGIQLGIDPSERNYFISLLKVVNNWKK